MKQQFTHTDPDTLVSMTIHTNTPSMGELEQWMSDDGGCEATDGCWVEPDGTCEHGCQSWLLELGAI